MCGETDREDSLVCSAMAVRKTIEESFVVAGAREEWLPKCCDALEVGRFTGIETSETLGQITANYKKAATWGTISLTLTPEGDSTRIVAKATANVDNVFAIFSSPGQRILKQFKAGIA